MSTSISGQSSSSDVEVRTERVAREEESELMFYGRASDNKACYFIFIFNTDFGIISKGYIPDDRMLILLFALCNSLRF